MAIVHSDVWNDLSVSLFEVTPTFSKVNPSFSNPIYYQLEHDSQIT